MDDSVSTYVASNVLIFIVLPILIVVGRWLRRCRATCCTLALQRRAEGTNDAKPAHVGEDRITRQRCCWTCRSTLARRPAAAPGSYAAVTGATGSTARHYTTSNRAATRLRRWLYDQTSAGFALDCTQALLSATSCLLYIVVSYAGVEPAWLVDLENVFTGYFVADYALRLAIAPDSLRYYLSFSSLVDFWTVVPAIVIWILQPLNRLPSDIASVSQIIRIMRVFRIFRVMRVLRALPVSASYAFQRQVFVLAMTVLSLIFVSAGIYQVRACGSMNRAPAMTGGSPCGEASCSVEPVE